MDLFFAIFLIFGKILGIELGGGRLLASRGFERPSFEIEGLIFGLEPIFGHVENIQKLFVKLEPLRILTILETFQMFGKSQLRIQILGHFFQLFEILPHIFHIFFQRLRNLGTQLFIVKWGVSWAFLVFIYGVFFK